MEQKLYEAARALPETDLEFQAICPALRPRHRRWRAAAVAAGLALAVLAGAVTVEAVEYRNAVAFFAENGLSSEGLSRAEVKAVYRDITTASFTYSGTAQVITQSLTTEQILGYELLVDEPTPEELEELWNYKKETDSAQTVKTGIHYEITWERSVDPQTDSYTYWYCIEKFDGETLLWDYTLKDRSITGFREVSDGILLYGETSSEDAGYYNWVRKLDGDGTLQWKVGLTSGLQIKEILEDPDGTYAVFLWRRKHLYLYRLSDEGELLSTDRAEITGAWVNRIIPFEDGYLVSMQMQGGEGCSILKLDREANVTQAFSYETEEVSYTVTDIITYNGNVYLSAYAVPAGVDVRDTLMAELMEQWTDWWSMEDDRWVLEKVRPYYTAVLLVCDPEDGTPQEFYTVEGAVGGALSLSDGGMLQWDVEWFAGAQFSAGTNAFSFVAEYCVYRYSFLADGALAGQEKIGETGKFYI